MNKNKYVSQNLYLVFLFILIFFIPFFILQTSYGDLKRPEPKKIVKGNKFLGIAECSGCHGQATPQNTTDININLNEYTIWNNMDSHSGAYNVLLNEDSKLIGRNLKLNNTPEESERCLSCHTTFAPAALWGNKFDLTDGVSCESCHGASEKWLELHTSSEWSKSQYKENGMYDTEELYSRAQLCVTCHIGDKDKQVDHELIAAGHPDLNRFEYNTFLALMPPHWRVKEGEKNKWNESEQWAAGNLITLKQSLKHLSNRVSDRSWPDFAEYNCFSCHHDLEIDDWRQNVGYPGRSVGFPEWNTYRYINFKNLSRVVSPDKSDKIHLEYSKLKQYMDRFGIGNKDLITSASANIIDLMNKLQSDMKDYNYDENFSIGIMRNITSDKSIGIKGIRSAQMAAVNLDSLYFKFSENTTLKNNSDIRKELDSLLDYLENPSAYNPNKFNEKMNKINKLLNTN